MSVHDALIAHRKQVVALIERSDNKRVACRQAGIHHSTFYRWRSRANMEPIGVPRRRWRDLRTDSQVLAIALAHPGLGPKQLAGELSRTLHLELSASTVWRILRHHRLNTRRLRYALMAQQPLALGVVRPGRSMVGELKADKPGDLVQMDCFHVGSFKETRLGGDKARRGVIWQYTAIDVASSFLWAELHTSHHNPDPTHTTALAYRVAQDLLAWGWESGAISTDNGNEFRAEGFRQGVENAGFQHRFIRAGRPQSNGKVERVQGTLLEEFYKPVLSRYVEPSITGLRRDLEDYLTYYNWERPHSGKWNQGRTPAVIIHPKENLIP